MWMRQQEIELTFRGFRYYYRVLGSKNESCCPILFLSGAFQTMDSWGKFVDYFNDKTTLILVDLPGVGKSDFLPSEYGLDFLADCIENVLVHVSIPKINVFSASYGSPIGYEFAKRYPHRVSHLLLAGIMREIPKESEASVYSTITFLQQNNISKFTDEVINGLLCMDTEKVSKCKIVARLFRNQLKQLTTNQMEKYIANTLRLFKHTPLDINQSPDVPTLVFTGEHDTFTKSEYCREIANSFQNSTFTTIKYADHLCHMEKFEVVIELSYRFFINESLEDISGCNDIEHIKN
jgi:pimeloyl-ACP methyl ester carboxylesterase